MLKSSASRTLRASPAPHNVPAFLPTARPRLFSPRVRRERQTVPIGKLKFEFADETPRTLGTRPPKLRAPILQIRAEAGIGTPRFAVAARQKLAPTLGFRQRRQTPVSFRLFSLKFSVDRYPIPATVSRRSRRVDGAAQHKEAALLEQVCLGTFELLLGRVEEAAVRALKVAARRTPTF